MKALPRLLALSLAVALPVSAFAAQTYALVVGVDQYPNDVSLDGAVRDAEDVYRSMSAAGFKVEMLNRKHALDLEIGGSTPAPPVRTDPLPPQAAAFLAAAVRAGLNILISGATQAGKTTMLNALAGAIPARERVVSCDHNGDGRGKLVVVVTHHSCSEFVCHISWSTTPPGPLKSHVWRQVIAPAKHPGRNVAEQSRGNRHIRIRKHQCRETLWPTDVADISGRCGDSAQRTNRCMIRH